MNDQRNTLLRIGASVLALVLFAAVPCVANAATLVFRNDTKLPIIIQGTTIINGMIRKGPTIQLAPGQTFNDLYVPPGNRVIVIVDGFQRLLDREVVPVFNPNQTLFFSVQPAPTGGVRLVPLVGMGR